MKRWWKRVVLYWHAPENGWYFYTRLDCAVEIFFMSALTILGEYRERH